ncbi:hypothetical protein [Pedococcus sp. 5OH_020]|uniref:hypothetical protein n=1 Tax=Pedococcus sp. 5OH_020 TaxID=2989814 RepID=UPI0022E9FC10|nr:hypothetical protein [Pedococcus sp. 5OH_020]
MNSTRIVTAAAGLVAAVGLSLGAASLASASNAPTAASGYRTAFAAPGGPASSDTPVTGSRLGTVAAAVKAKDSAVTVTSVRTDPDGSYDVFGTRAGAQVMLEVSKDLATVTSATGRPGGGQGGAGGSSDTPVTGSELAKVTAAVRSKDSTVTVASVRKDPDGSYDVFGTKAGAPVMIEVGKDLTTVTTNAGRRGAPGAGTQTSAATGTSSTTTT